MRRRTRSAGRCPRRVVYEPSVRSPCPTRHPRVAGTAAGARRWRIAHDIYTELGRRLAAARKAAGITPDQLEQLLGVGAGWVDRFENADPLPDTYTLLAIFHAVHAEPAKIFDGLNPQDAPVELRRLFLGRQTGDDVTVCFPYGKFDATYRLADASEADLTKVLQTLRHRLADTCASGTLLDEDGDAPPEVVASQSDAVADAFLQAVRLWPHVNPSDLWYFVVYRAYLDGYNHPAVNARLSFDQSWKRTGGWALERVVVRHYREFLAQHNVEIVILAREDKKQMLANLRLDDRLEADKLDVALLGGEKRQLFGVVHVKASIAERRTDDVPMSHALVQAGYFSPLWTMDCKATPAALPVNRGELGSDTGPKSAKRKDIEDDGYFSGCFSYNWNTKPTSQDHKGPGFVSVCGFADPNDDFARAAIAAWEAR